MEDPDGGRSKITNIFLEIKELSRFLTSIKFIFVGGLARET
jgi:hypothetical protein